MKKRKNVKLPDPKKIGEIKVRHEWKIKKMKCWNLDGSIETTIFDQQGNQVSKTYILPKGAKK